MKTQQRIDAFMSNVSPEPNTGCWLWSGTADAKGYGFLNGRSAHRLSFILFVGPIAPLAYILHRCDTPACVNPDHLSSGTQLQNMRDMIKRGRGRYGFSTTRLHWHA